ncbi:MAG TPA: glycosyltransferase [Anaerolineae bacterium]
MHNNSYVIYQELILQIREVVHRALPPDATVIVVSKGDSELLKLNGRRAWHFPQREDGVYAGYYPTDSVAAITHLEALRARGADYLLFPSTSFWWLEHYQAFGQHLESRYRVVVHQEDTCLVFALREAKTGQQAVIQSQLLTYQQLAPQFEEPERSLEDTVDVSLIDDLRILFDYDHYIEQVGSTFSSLDAALIDYLERGFREGYNPHILFDTTYYLDRYPQVRAAGANPLVHFLAHSIFEGLDPHPFFDTEYYYSQAPRLRQNRQNALVHYLTHEAYEDAPLPNPLFGNRYYLITNKNVQDSGLNPLVHYLKFGWEERRFISHLHKDIAGQLIRTSRKSLWRGKWKHGTVLLFSHGHCGAEEPVILQVAEALAADYHLNCLVVLFKRREWAVASQNHANVVVLDDFQLACDIFRPSTLRMLAKTLCSTQPLFAVCETPEVLGTLQANGVPTFYLCPDHVDRYPKRVLEKLFHQADRVIFAASEDFHLVARKIGFYPTNVALRPHGLSDPARPERSRERARKGLAGHLRMKSEPFIVLGHGVIANRGGFDIFLAVARMLRNRRPDGDVAFVWVVQRQAEPFFPDEFFYQDEIKKSGLEEVVYVVDEQEAVEYLDASDTLFLPLPEASLPAFVLNNSSAALPVIRFASSAGASESVANSHLVVPYLDLDAVCQKIATLCDGAACQEPSSIVNPDKEYAVKEYAGSLLELAGRDFHLPQEIYHLQQNGALKAPRKIVIPCTAWGVSGVNSTLEAIGQELIRLGWDVEIVFTRDQSEILQTAGDDAHMPQVPYRYLQPDNPGIAGMWEGLIAYLEMNAPCIMFMNYDFTANAIAPALTDRVGVVAWVQADDGDYYEQAYRLGRYCNAIVCVSECTKQRVADLNPRIGDRAQVIHNSSVWESEIVGKKSAPSAKMKLIYTGRLVQHQKRILDFIQLAHSLDSTGIDYQLTLAGEFSAYENTREIFETMARAHLEDGRISLPGRLAREQIVAELSNYDIFILLSDFEGLPLALLEAMAHGCVPVVAEMESGIPEVLTSGKNGLIVSGRDYDEWAALLIDLWQNPKKFSQLSLKARKTIRERFTVEQVGKQFDDLFRGVATEIGSGAYGRPPCLNWGEKRSPTGDVLPPPNMYRIPVHNAQRKSR